MHESALAHELGMDRLPLHLLSRYVAMGASGSAAEAALDLARLTFQFGGEARNYVGPIHKEDR